MESITKELREWFESGYVHEYYGDGDGDFKRVTTPWFGWRTVIEGMLDRIDAEHEAKVSYWQGASYKDGYNEGFAGADDWLGQHEDAMAEHGWVKLPVDADGVPIRVWDVLDPPDDCDDYVPLQVVRLTYDGYEDEWYFDGQAGGFTGMVGKCMDVAGWTHHRVPTVEELLREFVAEFNRDDSELTDEEIIERFAAKLRLAGDSE